MIEITYISYIFNILIFLVKT